MEINRDRTTTERIQDIKDHPENHKHGSGWNSSVFDAQRSHQYRDHASAPGLRIVWDEWRQSV